MPKISLFPYAHWLDSAELKIIVRFLRTLRFAGIPTTQVLWIITGIMYGRIEHPEEALPTPDPVVAGTGIA